MGWFTSQEDKNNKDYADGYKLGRSNNFLEDAARDVVTTFLPIGGNDIFEKGYEERSEEHTSELQSLMRISYAVFCLKKKKSLIHSKQTSTHSYNHALNDHIQE